MHRPPHITAAGAWGTLVTKSIGRLAIPALLCALGLASGSQAAKPDTLADRLTPDRLAESFPGADRALPAAGRPAAAEVVRDGDIAGYVFSVGDLVEPRGYGASRFDILLGLDLKARVTGAALIAGDEPLLRNLGGRAALEEALGRLAGLDVLTATPTVPEGYGGRGEVSVLAMLDAIYRAGRAVAVSRNLLGPGSREGRRLDLASFRPLDWAGLHAIGAVRRLSLSNGDVAAHAAELGAGPADMLFADLAVALATPALIGRNLLGAEAHAAAMAELAAGDSLLLLAAAGRAGLHQSVATLAETPQPSRLRLRQAGIVLPLAALDLVPFDSLAAAGAPARTQLTLIRVPAASGFDGSQPWTLEIAFGAAAKFGLSYSLPAELVIEAIPRMVAAADNRAAEVPGLWLSLWQDQSARIGLLLAALAALSAVLLDQSRLVRHAHWLPWLRGGFLAVSLVWIGWYAGAQLSITHLITLARAPFEGGGLEALLLDPLTLIVLVFGGLTLLLLGRGIFCGWLCPFGALQELLNKAARRLGVRQRQLPGALNERLWAVKYVAAMALVALVFIDQPRVMRAVEIEPFNTAILFGFVRAWPYVLFALAVLAAGLFVERAYCRYLCPLGGGLAILGRWRMLLWLKRRPECGRSCNTCQPLCPVQAIGDDGAINLNECYHCLACQVAYQDDQVCPPLVARRERRERLAEAPEPIAAE